MSKTGKISTSLPFLPIRIAAERMAEAIQTVFWSSSIRSSTSPPSLPSRLSPNLNFNFYSSQNRRRLNSSSIIATGRFSPTTILCEAVGLEAPAATDQTETKLRKKNVYEVENLTTWLLKKEQSGNIDPELTIVLSSISLACKQIASLLQRSSIVNLTGAHGTINIQGEDQKKLDVISNEVCSLVLPERYCLSLIDQDAAF